jgi:hypothetical protein
LARTARVTLSPRAQPVEGNMTMSRSNQGKCAHYVVWPVLGLALLLLPVCGGDCVSDSVSGVVDDVVDDVVAGIIEDAQNDNDGILADTEFGDEGNGPSGYGPHVESDGLLVAEAEHYSEATPNWFEVLGEQMLKDNRRWFVQDGAAYGPTPDPDGFHVGASGNAYVECLPDTRVMDYDFIEEGAIYGEGEGGARLDFEIDFETAGTYYVWVRAYSTGTEDNGVHVGVDGEIPESGRKIQLCAKNQWSWTNAQRGSGGSSCGVNGTITVTIWNPGRHTISFHQREDGFEFDRFVMTTNPGYVPTGVGPAESPMLF